MKTLSLLLLLTLFSCRPQTIFYHEVIENCLSESTNMPFTVDGGTRTGYSHTVETSCIVGAPLPEFEAIDINGNTITTKSLKGKINILNFWFTTCAPCIAEIPGLNQIKEKYGEQEINYISICRDDLEEVNQFLRKHPLNFDVIPDGYELTEKTFHSMWGFPLNIVTNKNNIIIAAFSGGPTDDSAPQVVFDKLSLILDETLGLVERSN